MDDYGNALMWVTQNENVFEVEEILTNILLRLPVKSLLICKSVSKYWRSIISRPSFVESHLIQSQHNPTYVFYPYDPWHHNLYLLRKMDGEMTESLPGCDGIYFKGIICSFNGLICCVNYYSAFLHDIRICNPATREVLLLPQSRELEHPGEVGVAFGPGINEYKVFRFFYAACELKVKHLECEVYSSMTESWRRIESVEHCPMDSTHVFVNGRVYWFICSEEHPVPGSILSVDKDENFREIRLPDEFSENSFLIDLDGCLSLVVVYDEDEEKMSIWVLKDCNESIWEKKCSDYIPIDAIECVDSVAARKNEIFFITSAHYLVFNVDYKTWTELDIAGTFEENFPVAFAFTESLLPCNRRLGS